MDGINHLVWIMDLIKDIKELDGSDLIEKVLYASKKFEDFSDEEKLDIFLYLLGEINNEKI